MDQHDTDSNHIGYEPCPACNSRNNLARYDDGHGYCFGCQYYEHGNGSAGTHQRTPLDTTLITDGEHVALDKRGISEETCRKFGYTLGKYNGRPCQIANYTDAAGHVVAQKLRFPDKSFMALGDLKKAR